MDRHIIEINTCENSHILKASNLTHVSTSDKTSMLSLNLTMGRPVLLSFSSPKEKNRCHSFLKDIMGGKYNSLKFDEEIIIDSRHLIWELDDVDIQIER